MTEQEFDEIVQRFHALADESARAEQQVVDDLETAAAENRAAAEALLLRLRALAVRLAADTPYLQLPPTVDRKKNEVLRLLWNGPGRRRYVDMQVDVARGEFRWMLGPIVGSRLPEFQDARAKEARLVTAKWLGELVQALVRPELWEGTGDGAWEAAMIALTHENEL